MGIACDFCEKTEWEVKKLITSDHTAAICNECVAVCVEIIQEDEKPLAIKEGE